VVLEEAMNDRTLVYSSRYTLVEEEGGCYDESQIMLLEREEKRQGVVTMLSDGITGWTILMNGISTTSNGLDRC